MSSPERLSVEMAREHVAGQHADALAPYCYRCEYNELRVDYANLLLLHAERPRRWTYRDWIGRLPSLGGDELGRTTLVLTHPFTRRAFVLALWHTPDRKHAQTCRERVAAAEQHAERDRQQPRMRLN